MNDVASPALELQKSLSRKTAWRRRLLYPMVAASGLAGLSWEILWHHYAALSTGVSASGAAITLSCTMFGLAVGSLLGGRLWSGASAAHPLRTYGILELCIGLLGLVLAPGFAALSSLDAMAFGTAPGLVPVVHTVGYLLLISLPAAAMGATVPLFARLARDVQGSIAVLYALNTAGAALGVWVISFLLIPRLGITLTQSAICVVNLSVAALAWLVGRSDALVEAAPAQTVTDHHGTNELFSPRAAFSIVFLTGAVTFCLEVAWFRSIRAAFQSTTESFALMLISVLIPLAIGGRLAKRLPARRSVGVVLLLVAGAFVLLSTPVVERFDGVSFSATTFWGLQTARFGLCLATIGLPILVLGMVLPWLFEQSRSGRSVGQLYAVNTLGAAIGALSAAWLLLPALGFAKAAWLAGGCLLVAGAILCRNWRGRSMAVGMAVASLSVAIVFESGVGTLRVQGTHLQVEHVVLGVREGPDSTVSVIGYKGGVRELVIDGFQTSGEARTGHYMRWMGHLPMLLHPRPRRALVICFGTGQTAHAVRLEGPEQLDIVDVNSAVFELAYLFKSNRGVLKDERVSAIEMDGRAWLRRTEQDYDVITLEPMAPYFAGTNALYSKEFYQLAAGRLTDGGVIAQWVPFHILTPWDAAGIMRTVQSVFPASWLWIDPVDGTGIIVGIKNGNTQVQKPPFAERAGAVERDMALSSVFEAFTLGPQQLRRLGEVGRLVTDDNQLLSYGTGQRDLLIFRSTENAHRYSLELVARIARGESLPEAIEAIEAGALQ